MNSSEYAPDLLGARGVANPGAPFFRPQGKFFATKCARMSARMCARIHMRPPAGTSAAKSRSARPAACSSASIVESRPVPLSRLNVPPEPGMTVPDKPRFLSLSQPLTRSTAPQIHPLETLTTTAPQIRSRSFTTSRHTPDLLDLHTHRNHEINHRLKLFFATTTPLDLHDHQHPHTADSCPIDPLKPPSESFLSI